MAVLAIQDAGPAASSVSDGIIRELIERGELWKAQRTGSSEACTLAANAIINFGIPEIDSALQHGGLDANAIHEFFITGSKDQEVVPPCGILVSLLKKLFPAEQQVVGAAETATTPPYVLWIGKKVWPSAYALEHTGLIARSIFLDPHDRKELLQAVELALRSSACISVVAHIEKIPFALTQRFSLDMRDGPSKWFFLLRPETDLHQKTLSKVKSAAGTRWIVRPESSISDLFPSWSLQLYRQKGACNLERQQIWNIRLDAWDGVSAWKEPCLQLASTSAEPIVDSLLSTPVKYA